MTLAALQTAKRAAQAALEAQYPGAIILAGRAYKAAVQIDAVSLRQRADGSGLQKVQQITVTVLKSRLATAPESREKFTCKGFEWRIDDVAGLDACEIAWTITGVRFLT